jgi:site-specific DNA-methyltransferase (cytosine-N4-specific)
VQAVTPYIDDTDFTLYVGDVREVLATMPAESVHCVVTSPPYWGLRDYGTGLWDGGDPDCDHTRPPGGTGADPKYGANRGNAGGAPTPMGDTCVYCGARRVDQQLGLEPTPDAYVQNMVEVFREVRRVLRRDGTCWLNLGDSYNANVGAGFNANARIGQQDTRVASGLPPKNLLGMPWRVAFALQADGWYLRSDIIWAKPNPMPESVTDRPTKAHEYLFLLTRSPRYFYDADAIREKVDQPTRYAGTFRHGKYVNNSTYNNSGSLGPGEEVYTELDGHTGRNRRSVWEIATEPYPAAHFATFPQALVEPCVKAGCPEGGTILDPFMGSGTTALVARKHGRRSIGIELNLEYADLAARRLSQLSLLAEA